MENPALREGLDRPGGPTAKFLAALAVEACAVRCLMPPAYRILSEARSAVYLPRKSTLLEVVEAIRSGRLLPASEANCTRTEICGVGED